MVIPLARNNADNSSSEPAFPRSPTTVLNIRVRFFYVAVPKSYLVTHQKLRATRKKDFNPWAFTPHR
jgi:hypothetical protein